MLQQDLNRIRIAGERLAARPLETWLALLALLWGAWLLLPFDTFNSTPAFAAMAQRGPEYLWGLGIGLVGLGQLIALVLLRRRWLLGTLILSAGFWFFVSAMLIIVNPAGTGTVVYPLAALGSLWRLNKT